jgi:hypothetical protein
LAFQSAEIVLSLPDTVAIKCIHDLLGYITNLCNGQFVFRASD